MGPKPVGTDMKAAAVSCAKYTGNLGTAAPVGDAGGPFL